MNVMPHQPGLRDELLRRAQRDQEVRLALADPPTCEQWDAVKAVDADNSPWLETVIAQHGWPGVRLVGAEAAHAAWLLAQHAPLNLQQVWLPLLREAVAAEDAREVDLAYLDDRVRIREQRPQRYGTQWRVHDGEQRLFPLDDLHEVNDRRMALGLPVLEEEALLNALPEV